MAYVQYEIGSGGEAVYFRFISLSGVPQFGREVLQPLERTGVDGTGYRKTGVKSAVFEMTSIVATDDLDTALLLVQEYQTAIGAGALTFEWRDIDIDTEAALNTNYKVNVIDVELIRIQQRVNAVGNVLMYQVKAVPPPDYEYVEATSGSLICRLICKWTLQLSEV